MNPSKPRKRSKWLAKVFQREDSGSSAPSEPSQPPPGQSQPTVTGAGRHDIPSAPPSVPQVNIAKSDAHNSHQTQPPLAVDQSNDDDKSGQLVLPLRPYPDVVEKPIDFQNQTNIPHISLESERKGILEAPAPPKKDTGKSTSWNYKIEESEKVPRLLDPRITLNNAKLWEKAYSQLSGSKEHRELFEKYEAILEETSPGKKGGPPFPKKVEASVQRQIDIMKQKQWVLQWDQKSIVVRDQAERIVKFVQTFSALGTAIAQIDPVHVGIPWAGVCAVLTLILKDTTQHQAALDGLEEVSTIVAKYIAIEDVYVQSCELDLASQGNKSFEDSIIKVYSAVLTFQVRAALHFHRPTMARTISNIVKTVDWDDLLSKVKQSDSQCVALTSMTGISNMGLNITNINRSLVEIEEKWNEIHEIRNTLEKFQEDRDRNLTQNAKIIGWISDSQVGEDHERVRTKLGSSYWNAGQWFLQNWEYQTWKRSQHGAFWLQGSVGTGKTSLASIVINELVRSGGNTSIGFYYCSRSLAASSNNPTSILRSLVAQVSCTGDGEEVYQVIKDWYKRDAKRYVTGSRLSLTECEDLLVTLMKLRGKTVIVLDGVDECTEPMQLLRALHEIWKRFSHLKIFLTSRLDVAVPEVFPKISIVQSDFGKTTDDIKEYIKAELQRKERRNPKVITNELADRMVNILTQRAQGMFRWVELQLDLLISPERRIKYRRDFEDRLARLEHGSGQEVLDSLRETYDDIYERNTQGPHSRRLAEKSLKWVLCAARPLKVWELGAAVSINGDSGVTTDLIVDICSNFFMVDPKGFVQLAHLSVREYLEVKDVGGRLIFSPQEAHAEAAYTCLLYWKVMSERVGDEQEDESGVSDSEDDSEDDTIYSVDSDTGEVVSTEFMRANKSGKRSKNQPIAADGNGRRKFANPLDGITAWSNPAGQQPDVDPSPEGSEEGDWNDDPPPTYEQQSHNSSIPSITIKVDTEESKHSTWKSAKRDVGKETRATGWGIRPIHIGQQTDTEDEQEQRFRGRITQGRTIYDAEFMTEEAKEANDLDMESIINVAPISKPSRVVWNDKESHERQDHKNRESKSSDKALERDVIQQEADRVYRETIIARNIASGAIHSRNPSPERSVLNRWRETGSREHNTVEGEVEESEETLPPDIDAKREISSATGDYFSQASLNLLLDSSHALKPRKALARFQRYASIYWATHCQACKTIRLDESRPLNQLFWDFLSDNGDNPAFQLWATVLLNETKLASIPIITPAPMIFVPATAHERAILDAEPMYERWQETIARVDGPWPLMPAVSLIACFYGFIDVLEEMSEDGEAQVMRNHEGIMGLVLAARNGWNEVFELPVFHELDLDIPDREGRTGLHHAALGGYVDFAKFLLGYTIVKAKGRRMGKKEKKKRRVDVNIEDKGGRTPLHYAAEAGHVDVVKLLLEEEDLDIHVRNHWGNTALKVARAGGDVAGLLRGDARYVGEDETWGVEWESKIIQMTSHI